MMEQLK